MMTATDLRESPIGDEATPSLYDVLEFVQRHAVAFFLVLTLLSVLVTPSGPLDPDSTALERDTRLGTEWSPSRQSVSYDGMFRHN